MNRRQASAAILAATVFPELPRAIAGARQTGYALGERIPLRAEYGGLYFDVRTRRLHVGYPALPTSPDEWNQSQLRRHTLHEYGRCRGWRYVSGFLPSRGAWLSAVPWGSRPTPNSPNGGLRIIFSGLLVVCYNYYGASKARVNILPHSTRQEPIVLRHAWCDNPAPEEMS